MTLTAKDVRGAGLTDWSRLGAALHARYATPDYATGLAFVAAAGAEAERADHHPEMTLSYGSVDLRLLSHDEHALTQRDLRLARRLSELAAEHGLTPVRAELTTVDLALDTPDHTRIGPFWAAVLTGRADALHGDEVRDPTLRTPLLWFQECEPGDEPRMRFHLDVWVAPEHADSRIGAALAAGGRINDDSQAPSFVVLADAEGNKACICTELDRDENASSEED